jgi:glycosyltransferase involved in cell wall biosynthesis
LSRFAVIGSRGYPSTYGGFETMVRHLAPFLVEQGHDVTVYDRRGQPGLILNDDGVRTVVTRGFDGNVTSTLSYGASAVRHATRERPDAALVLNVANGPYLPFLKRYGIPTVVNVDGLEWERDKWSALGKRAFLTGAQLSAKYATSLVFDAEAIGDYWRERFGVNGTFIPYGADVPATTPDPALLSELNLVAGSYVLVVARLVPENSIDVFLDAVDALPQEIPVVVVGSSNKETAISARLAALVGERLNFSWLGHVNDQALLTALWAHCGLYFHGHTVGGTNPALLQALSCGAPVIAMDTVFNREVATGCADFVTPDAAALAKVLATRLRDQGWRGKMRLNGPQRVSERYTWLDVCQRYLATLEAAAGSPAERRLRPGGGSIPMRRRGLNAPRRT